MQTDDKIRVVILSAFYEPYMSGAEQMVKEIAERLGNNYDITLITARLDKKLARQESRDTFTLIRVGWGSRLDKFFYPLLAAIKLRRFKPDLIHAVMESYAGGALALAKWFYSPAKRILTLQSGDLDSEKKQKQWLIKIFWKLIHRSPDYLTAISNFLAQRAKGLGVDENKIKVIPNGVDLSEVPVEVNKIDNRVICVARLSWEKGLDYLVKAWPKVLTQVPEAKLVLAGEGDKRQEIEKLIRNLEIIDSVELLGNLPHRQVLQEIKKSEVFICPSLAEGLGIVFIEAQACGVVPIGTRVGGIPDVIQDNQNGLLIKPKSSEDISQAIIKLLTDKDLSERLVSKAQETVKRYDWNTIINQIERVYRKLLVQHHP